jgi:MoaA/NifB/PqqE/SkfB family radical SAM enzyme
MKSRLYHSFWNRIHYFARGRGYPLRVMFELTYRCNFHCRHCYVPCRYRRKRELKTREVFSVLDQLADIGCLYLGFTGGEPFVRKDILDILWHAKRKGFVIIIYSNGSLIDKRMAGELGRLRPNKVDITIPAMSKDAFERVSQVSGSHRKVFCAIELLRKEQVSLGFKTCVLKENETEIKDIQDFAASLGALHRLDTMLSPRLDGSREPYRYRGSLKISGQGQAEDCNSSRERLTVSGFRLAQHTARRKPQTTQLFKCGVGLTQAAITPRGELKMCLMIDYPRFPVISEHLAVFGCRRTPHPAPRTPNLKESWQKLKDLVASVKPDKRYKCNKCALEQYCKWCPASAWLYRKNFTVCNPENRKWAEILRARLSFT